jgi:transcriptional regulator with XRE-family HTH domain
MQVETRSGGVGRLLQQWRHARQLSQLVLAGNARVSSRHLSFIESGRAAPSRDMILTLATALDVPLRDRNQLLLAGGFAPVYRETPLTDPVMAPVRDALERVLSHHEPYPAVVMDRHWNVLRANEAATAMFAFLLAGAPASDQPNVVRLMFGQLRPYVANFAEVGPALIQRAHRETIAGVLDPQTDALLTEVLALPGIPASWRRADFTRPILPVVPVRFERDAVAVSYFSMVTTVGTPQDVTSQEIRLEGFFPMDDATVEHRWT